MEISDWPSILLLAVLIALSAFFSASEMAFSSVNLMRMKSMSQDGNKKAKDVLTIVENFDRTLTTILIGNNVVNIASASLATLLATDAFGPGAVAISTGVMTVLVLIFGEILPKSFAKQNADRFTLIISPIMLLLMRILSPVVWPFLKLRNMRKQDSTGEELPTMTEQELMYMIEAIEEEGVLEEQESELVQSALEFDDTSVQEILTHRVDVTAVDISSDGPDLLKLVMSANYSRLPVYQGSIDNVRGVVRTRDILEAAISDPNNINLAELMTECVYIHKTMKLSHLLGMFQRSKSHLAVVTDDYGGMLGIVTLEDVLEQLVGDIWDESDEVVQGIVCTDTDTYLVTGDQSIYDVFEEMDYSPKAFDSDYNTMAGWAMEQFQRIPHNGDHFVHDRLKVTVTEMDETRITRLKVELLPIEPADKTSKD